MDKSTPPTVSLTGKKALVTGGAVRVGRAISLALADAGCELFVHYGSSAAAAQTLKTEIESRGGRCEIGSADLSDAEATAELMDEVVVALGAIDILVNSAAIYLDGNLEETTLDMWETQFAINLRAPFQLCQAFVRQLPEGQAGHIVNIIDARLNRAGKDHFAYRLTKGGLRDMTQNLALDLAPSIQVNALALGAILPPPGEPEAYLERLADERVPLQRAGSAEIVADNVLHLLCSPFTTGAILPLDGGEFL